LKSTALIKRTTNPALRGGEEVSPIVKLLAVVVAFIGSSMAASMPSTLSAPELIPGSPDMKPAMDMTIRPSHHLTP